MNKQILAYFMLVVLISAGCIPKTDQAKSSFKEQIDDYIQKFPYQDTYNYMKKYTGGDPSKLNKWVLGEEPVLVKAGEDKVVRMNNDTYYKLAFMDFSEGPVQLSSNSPSDDRFYSFQLMDDRNANFKNVINPKGNFYLYFGDTPPSAEGTLIVSPSEVAVVIVRVEVKDKFNEEDVAKAKKIFNGIKIAGPVIERFPVLDLLSSFSEEVAKEAVRKIDSTSKVVPFRLTVASPDMIPGKVSYLYHAAGTKSGWGGPLTSHSAYEIIFFDKDGEVLDGGKGTYRLTMSEPPVDAFWSFTVYDSERSGFFHPNRFNRYHINNTTAVRNDDGTITFHFKTHCENGDLNCLEVPAGLFDMTARYYLPHEEIRNGDWTLPRAELVEK